MSELTLASSSEEAIENICKFATEFEWATELQARASRFRAWYAVRNSAGEWAFGPSKFIGYRNNDAARYLRTADTANGGETERVLEAWFDPVDLDTPLGRDLWEALRSFLAARNRVPRKSIRISVSRSELDKLPAAPRAPAGDSAPLLSRISMDPRICGGRPCIKGTRMRVSDIVDMLAHGAERAEILEDFPYLADEDIAAALAYAARAADHRVIRAA